MYKRGMSLLFMDAAVGFQGFLSDGIGERCVFTHFQGCRRDVGGMAGTVCHPKASSSKI